MPTRVFVFEQRGPFRSNRQREGGRRERGDFDAASMASRSDDNLCPSRPSPSHPTFTAARPYYELRNHRDRRSSIAVRTAAGRGATDARARTRTTEGPEEVDEEGSSAWQAVIYLACSPHSLPRPPLPARLFDR